MRRTEKLPALTSLRFFAAFYIVLHHALRVFLPGIPPDGILWRFIQLGWCSVTFFFILSGYILCIVYLKSGEPVPLRSFFRARFARVYPLFLLTLVLDTPNLFLKRLATFGMKIAAYKTAVIFSGHLVMLNAWIPQLRGIDAPNWSLSVETVFYLCFPFLGVALSDLRGHRLWIVATFTYLGGMITSYEAYRHVGGDLGSHLPLINLYFFVLGILLGRWQMLRGEQDAQVGRTITRQAYITSAAELACFSAVVYWSPQIPNPNLIAGLLVPAFVGMIWAFSHSDWLPARLLSARWLVVLGEASFGLYLFHVPVLHLFQSLGWDREPKLFIVYLATSIGVSVLSFYLFETPARRWLMKSGWGRMKETLEMASDAQ